MERDDAVEVKKELEKKQPKKVKSSSSSEDSASDESDDEPKTMTKKSRQNNLSYAAINVHNINLIYLKWSLLEKLMVDADKFHDRVVGSIVRIRISSNDQSN